jgi:chromosome segregation ATPase
MHFDDLKLEAIITLRVDGTPSDYSFNIRRLHKNDDGTEFAPSRIFREPATVEDLAKVLDTAALTLNEEMRAMGEKLAAANDVAAQAVKAVEAERAKATTAAKAQANAELDRDRITKAARAAAEEHDKAVTMFQQAVSVASNAVSEAKAETALVKTDLAVVRVGLSQMTDQKAAVESLLAQAKEEIARIKKLQPA